MKREHDKRICKGCGQPVPEEAPFGKCPACLLKAGFDAPWGDSLHLKCPHCRGAIELLHEPAAREEVLCPSCGSSISLLEDETVTAPPPSLSTLGRFQLIERVGLGAFGAVWKARDTDLDRVVALKAPRREQLLPEEQEQFLREARSAASLQHPNIVGVHDVGRVGDTVFIVSDFIDGVSLAEWLTARKPTPRETAELCVKIAEALHHAHEAGVVHRDLKPSNILLNAHNEPHIADFGLAKRDSGEITMTVEGQVLGTPAYMAPEQARGEAHSADRRSDVYSLGVILFEMLTGEKPFRGATRMLLHQVLHDEPPAPRRLNASIPKDLETITLKCMDKSPERRYRTAEALVADLRLWLEGKSIHARPITPPERFWRWCRRNPMVAGLTAAVFAAVLTGAVATTHYSIQAKERSVAERQETRRATRMFYASQINQAQQELRDGNIPAFLTRIKHCSAEDADGEDLRGFEWHYLDRLKRNDLYSLKGLGFTVSPDGLRIAQLTDPKTVRILDAAGGEPLYSFQHPLEDISDYFTFSPDGSMLAIRGKGAFSVHDMKDGRLVRRFKAHQQRAGGIDFRVRNIAFDPSGRRVASSGFARQVYIWDLQTGEQTRRLKGHRGIIDGLAFCLNGRRLVTYSEDGLRLWDSATGEEIRDLPDTSSGSDRWKISPDGAQIAKLNQGGKGFTVWSATDGEEIQTGGGGESLTDLQFAPDGRQIATLSSAGRIQLWDLRDGSLASQWRGLTLGKQNAIREFGFVGDRGLFALATDEVIEIRNLQSGNLVRSFWGHASRADRLDVSPDGRRIYLLCDGEYMDGELIRELHVWDATADARNLKLDFVADRVTWSPDGRWLAMGDWLRRVIVANADTGKVQREFYGHAGEILSLSFSPSGDRVVSSATDGKVMVWNLVSGEKEKEFSVIGYPYRVGFSREGRHVLASGHAGRTQYYGTGFGYLNVFDLEAGTEVFSSPDLLPRTDVASLAGIREAQSALDQFDGGLQLNRLLTGAELASMYSSLAFSPDGAQLAGGNNQGEPMTLWDCKTGRQAGSLPGHFGEVSSISYSEDGSRIISTGQSGEVIVWDAGNTLPLLQLDSPIGAGIVDVELARDGMRMAAALDHVYEIRIWDARPLTEERRTLRQAISALQWHLPKAGSLDEFEDSLKEDPMITESVRTAALEMSAHSWENHLARQAVSSVESLFRKGFLKSEVVAELKKDEDLDAAVKELALKMAESSVEHAEELNRVAWRLAFSVKEDSPVGERQRALRLAETAAKLAPARADIANTLGAAQYNAGKFAEAVKSLTRSKTKNEFETGEAHQADLSYLAMALHKLGRREEAQATFEALKELDLDDPYVYQARAVLNEE